MTRDRFISCREQTARGIGVEVDKVLDTYQETSAIPGTTQQAPSTAVSVQLTISEGGAKQQQKTTVHEFPVSGQWRWSLDERLAEAFKAGRCS